MSLLDHRCDLSRRKVRLWLAILLCGLVVFGSWLLFHRKTKKSVFNEEWAGEYSRRVNARSSMGNLSYGLSLANSAEDGICQQIAYDASYSRIPYPNGDVPFDRGVCSDVVIRAYRGIGVDLQKKVHEDMNAHFNLYPALWGLNAPDSNIDHRRVPNLMIFFSLHGLTLPITQTPSDYWPGDIITWDINGRTHIGIVSNSFSSDGVTRKIIHNFGRGQVMENFLFSWPIIGHFRFQDDGNDSCKIQPYLGK